MDPLSVLREYTMRGELDSIRQVGDEFHFADEYRFPCNLETPYRSKQGSLYTLDSLVFFVKNTRMKHTEYMQQTRALKLQTVTFVDRKGLLDYLEGRVQNSDAIEILPPSAASAVLPGSMIDSRILTVPISEDVEEYRPENPMFGPFKRMRFDIPEADAEYEPEEIMDASHMVTFIRERERPIRDRNSILLCHNKDFQEILAMLARKEEEKKKTEGKEGDKSVDAGDAMPWKDRDAEEPGTDTSQLFTSGSTKQKGTGKPSTDVKSYRQPALRPSVAVSTEKVKIEGPPIILVPSAFQTMLNMYNVKEFLEDGTYVAADVKAKAIAKKPEVVTFLRKIGRQTPVKYEVRDKPSGFSSKDWDRVLAVFVLGKEWQFKDWPFKDHVEIFSKIMGIFLRFEDDSVESAKVVKQWNVKIISLSKHKRHQDRTAVLQFWDSLEAFVRAKNLNIVF